MVEPFIIVTAIMEETGKTYVKSEENCPDFL